MTLLDAYVLATARVNGPITIAQDVRDFLAEKPGIRVPDTL